MATVGFKGLIIDRWPMPSRSRSRAPVSKVLVCIMQHHWIEVGLLQHSTTLWHKGDDDKLQLVQNNLTAQWDCSERVAAYRRRLFKYKVNTWYPSLNNCVCVKSCLALITVNFCHNIVKLCNIYFYGMVYIVCIVVSSVVKWIWNNCRSKCRAVHCLNAFQSESL